MDEMFVNIVSKDLHELREDIGNQVRQLSEIKATLAKVETLDRTSEMLMKKMDVSSQFMSGLSREVGELYVEVQKLRKDLSRPLRHEHHNHFPKIIWVVVVLLIGVAVTASGWFGAWQKALMYRDADTKIRYLRLMPDDSLYFAVRYADSLVKADPIEVRDSVSLVEEARERYWETIRESEILRRKGYGR